jgi:hypothetical protein
MVRIDAYDPAACSLWDEFIARSKNGTFLFLRDYMDYHHDRFQDHSLLFFEEDRLLAVLPANVRDGVFYTHGGLTFGGIVSDGRMKTAVMLQIFDALQSHLRRLGIVRVLYKTVPHIYHAIPAEEDLYALFCHGARLARRDVSSSLWMQDRPALGKGRKWSAKQAKKNGLEIRRSTAFRKFMAIEERQLGEKYGTRPTHTGAEMELLAGRFPEHIKLFGAYRGEILVGGIVIYETRRVAHAQYIAATDEGKESGAIDGILDVLLTETYSATPYFDFGISTEKQGRHLNAGLIAYKEGHGARAVAYDSYEWDLAC